MVLEACDRPALPRHELALEQHVADHPPFPRDGLVREEPDAGERRAVAVEVAAAEQLIAAADGEQRCARRGGLLDRRPFVGEVRRDQRLLAVLAAADVEQIVLAGPHLVAQRDGRHLELVAAEARPAVEDGDVAAIGVDVQVVRIQVPDRILTCRSQYGLTRPRSVTIRCSASIAV